MKPERRQEILDSVDNELVSLYTESTKQPEWIVRAFLASDQEPPTREQWMTRGLTAAEDRLVDEFRSNPNEYAGDFSGTAMGDV
jgi:hypothetical protein